MIFHCFFALTILCLFCSLFEFSFYELNLKNVKGFTLKIYVYRYSHMNVITCALGVIVSHLENASINYSVYYMILWDPFTESRKVLILCRFLHMIFNILYLKQSFTDQAFTVLGYLYRDIINSIMFRSKREIKLNFQSIRQILLFQTTKASLKPASIDAINPIYLWGTRFLIVIRNPEKTLTE